MVRRTGVVERTKTNLVTRRTECEVFYEKCKALFDGKSRDFEEYTEQTEVNEVLVRAERLKKGAKQDRERVFFFY